MPTEWEGIKRDTGYDKDGALFVANARYYLEGELQRRAGFQKLNQSAQPMSVMSTFRHPQAGMFVVYADQATGTVAYWGI
jgi:hypothetical protein